MTVAVAGARLPLNLGLIAAVASGLAAGLLHQKIRAGAA
jgi:hypothetical protein